MPGTHGPGLAYLLEAQRIRAELEAQGMDLDPAAIRDLARARIGPPKRWVAQEPALTPKGRDILDRIAQAWDQDHRCACRRAGRFQEQHPVNATCPLQDQDQTAPEGAYMVPEISSPLPQAGLETGPDPSTVAPAGTETPD